MKKTYTHVYNKRLLLFSQMLLFAVSMFLLAFMKMISYTQQTGFNELIQKNLTFNIIYLLCMFDAICFLQMLFYGKKIKNNEHFESSMIGVFLIALAQIFLLDIFAGGALLFFMFTTLRKNGFGLRRIYTAAKGAKELKLPLVNLVFYILTIVMLYIMIMHQFA